MASFTFRMPAGVPGTPTRLEHSTIDIETFDPAVPFPAYGLPMKTGANGKMQPIGAGDAASAMKGILIRPYPTTGGATQTSTIGSAVPPTSGVCNRLRRGWAMVVLGGAAAAAKDAQVYIRIAAAAAGKPIGGFEAAADGVNTIAPAELYFRGTADAQGNVEVEYKI